MDLQDLVVGRGKLLDGEFSGKSDCLEAKAHFFRGLDSVRVGHEERRVKSHFSGGDGRVVSGQSRHGDQSPLGKASSVGLVRKLLDEGDKGVFEGVADRGGHGRGCDGEVREGGVVLGVVAREVLGGVDRRGVDESEVGRHYLVFGGGVGAGSLCWRGG